MKRTILAVAAAVLLASAALAQPHEMGNPMREHLNQAAGYLNLTASQRASWDAALSDVETQNGALMSKNHDLQKQLHEALAASSPDACAVGNLAIQSHATMDQLKAAHDALIAKLASYLTPDQKTKFDAYVAASMAERHGPPMH
jgi:Spy/CpxP family protein refolding chaperone